MFPPRDDWGRYEEPAIRKYPQMGDILVPGCFDRPPGHGSCIAASPSSAGAGCGSSTRGGPCRSSRHDDGIPNEEVVFFFCSGAMPRNGRRSANAQVKIWTGCSPSKPNARWLTTTRSCYRIAICNGPRRAFGTRWRVARSRFCEHLDVGSRSVGTTLAARTESGKRRCKRLCIS